MSKGCLSLSLPHHQGPAYRMHLALGNSTHSSSRLLALVDHSYHYVFVDESGCDKRIGFRQTGWSPLGVTPIQVSWFQREQRYQILPAYTQDGDILARVFQGSTDSAVFEDFIEQLLPLCGKWPEPKSALVMDNASFHHTERIEQMCYDAGVKLVYLPPYSPHFNPIEEFFAELKAFIKRNWHNYKKNPEQGLHSVKMLRLQSRVSKCPRRRLAPGRFDDLISKVSTVLPHHVTKIGSYWLGYWLGLATGSLVWLAKLCRAVVVNVARYYHHETARVAGEDDGICKNVRKGLDITKATNYNVRKSIISPNASGLYSSTRKGRSTTHHLHVFYIRRCSQSCFC